MYAGSGKLIDVLGTRKGFLLIMLWWSLACASQGLAISVPLLAVSLFLLGMGEGGGFPAATKAMAEWFPTQERSTAMGLMNAGTAVGAVAAPPLIALTLAHLSWRWVFFLAGAVGLAWTLWWMSDYHPAAKHPEPGRGRAAGTCRSACTQGRQRREGPLDRSVPLSASIAGWCRQVSERRGLVLLYFLAAQISLRRSPF